MISSYVKCSSLPSFASTCRAFEHPALNALWRDLQSVKPLVKCLPDDLFGFDKGGVVGVPLSYDCGLPTKFIYAGITGTS